MFKSIPSPSLAVVTRRLPAGLATLLLALAMADVASAQRAGSWVDIGRGVVGSGASADGPLKFAHSKSSSNNGVDFGHGFAVGAGPNGIALSNSIGAGSGPLGAAHNVQLNLGPGGTHVSHGGVVSEGGNRRVIAGGSTGTSSRGQVYGGSSVTGFGNRTKAYSKSHTRQWNNTNTTFQNPQPVFNSSTRQVVQPTFRSTVNPSMQNRTMNAVPTQSSGWSNGRVVRTQSAGTSGIQIGRFRSR